jgi:hypothetical protein
MFNKIINDTRKLLGSHGFKCLNLRTYNQIPHVWIKDKENIIGNPIQDHHYELRKENSKVIVELRFEDIEIRKEIRHLLNLSSDKVNWIEGKAAVIIQYKCNLQLKNHSIANQLKDAIIEFDSIIGDGVRSILLRINTTDKDNQLSHFLKRWPLEKVKKMTLDEYNQQGNKDTFCYWLEYETRSLINISGQANSFKFEIFERKEKNRVHNSTNFKQDDVYSWRSRAGDTSEQAFEKTKNNIVRVIISSLKGNFKDIDNREIKLAPLYKWKIAFLYSNKQLLAISDIKAVKWLANYYNMPNQHNARISSVHQFLMNQIDRNRFWDEDSKLWHLYRTTKENIIKDQSIKTEAKIYDSSIKSEYKIIL